VRAGKMDELGSGQFAMRRRAMVEGQIRARGVVDPRVLLAMGTVPRHLFVPPEISHSAYEDEPLPIGEGQTISQPYMVAWMTEALGLQPGQKVLEIGTGSGYQAAVLSALGLIVHTVERSPVLAGRAENLLTSLGYGNVTVHGGDGTLGWPEAAPYDGIIVTAGGPKVPEALTAQLDPGGGVLVIPVGDRYTQELYRITRKGDTLTKKPLGGCRFVPLVGEEGWR